MISDPVGTPRDAAGTACGGTPQLHDHAGGEGFVGAGVDEDEGAGGAVAAVGSVDEGDGANRSEAFTQRIQMKRVGLSTIPLSYRCFQVSAWTRCAVSR